MNQTIMIIIGVFGISFLMMIPLLILKKKRNKSKEKFIEKNSDKAILEIYGEKVMINGSALIQYEPIKGDNGETIVALYPGENDIQAVFRTTTIELNKTINLKTEKLNFSLMLEAGKEYIIGLYLDAGGPEDGQEAILSLPLEIEGGGMKREAYLICFKK